MDLTSTSNPKNTAAEPAFEEFAHLRLRTLPADRTLEGSVLLEQLVIRLCSDAHHPVANRAEAVARAAGTLRRVLVEHARVASHESTERGCRVRLAGAKMARPCPLQQLMELNEQLEKLAGQDARMARVVELRYFGGMSTEEVAEALGVAEGMVKRDWRLARAWLFAQLQTQRRHGEVTDAG